MHTFRHIDTIQPLRAWETALHELMTLLTLALAISLAVSTLCGVLYGSLRMWRFICALSFPQQPTNNQQKGNSHEVYRHQAKS